MPNSFYRLTKKHLPPLLLGAVLVVITFAWGTGERARQDKLLTPPAAAPAGRSGYLQRARLVPQLREALRVLGDRLEKPGKERLTLMGQLGRRPEEKRNMRLILEYPDKLRWEEPDGITVYDGTLLKSTKPNRTAQDDEEIESLLSDSAEHFFSSLAQGAALRFLGSRFRLDDVSNAKYDGPYYEIYLLNDRVPLKQEESYQPKQFYLNSDTLLLERVRYDLPGAKTKVEVQLSGWRKVGDQFVPHQITRQEDGVVKLHLSIASVVAEARRDDGIFTLP